MEEPMLLPVEYLGKELEFEIRLQQGYIPRVEIIIDGVSVIFETDDSGDYRALSGMENKQISDGLLQAIASQLEILFNPK